VCGRFSHHQVSRVEGGRSVIFESTAGEPRAQEKALFPSRPAEGAID